MTFKMLLMKTFEDIAEYFVQRWKVLREREEFLKKQIEMEMKVREIQKKLQKIESLSIELAEDLKEFMIPKEEKNQ